MVDPNEQDVIRRRMANAIDLLVVAVLTVTLFVAAARHASRINSQIKNCSLTTTETVI